MQDTEDHYYIDAFNFLDTTILRNGGLSGKLAGTQRLYTTTESGDLDKCILIAPYIEPLQFVGRNAWSDGAGSFMDQVTDVFQGVMQGFNNIMTDLKGDSDRVFDFLSNLLPNSFGKINSAADLKGKLDAILAKIPTTEYKAINIGEFKRQYQGSSVEPPVASLSTMYFSNTGDFKWFNSTWSNEKQPLRKMCAALMRMLIGDIAEFTKTKAEINSGIIQYAPMMIQSRQPKFRGEGSVDENMYLPRSFAIVTGDVTSRRNAAHTLYNLLPESITIAPSRMLTYPDNDYYYVKIDVTFSLASYIGAQTLADKWITTGDGVQMYEDLTQSGMEFGGDKAK